MQLGCSGLVIFYLSNLLVWCCKDQFQLEPRIGMDPGPKNLNNKFVKSGRKSQSESKVKILVDSIKWKELHILTCKKHPRTCPNNMIDGEEFFLFTVVFFQPFSLSSPPFLARYILRFLRQFLHPCVSQMLRVSLSPFALP